MKPRQTPVQNLNTYASLIGHRMIVRLSRALMAGLLSLMPVGGGGAEAEVSGATGDGVGLMQWHPEFQVREVAREPVVFDPVDLEFDERGNAFVLEMPGYPVVPESEGDHPARIILMSDENGDGVFDRRRVFADRFRYATSILPHRGGLLVASPPDLLFLKDSDGDGRADIRFVLLSGFDVGNTQHNFNGLIHGLDNWVYAASGGNSGRIGWVDQPDQAQNLNRRDFRFQVESREIDFISRTTSGFGIALDDWGHVFTTHNMHHIHHLVFPDRYMARNPFLSGSAIGEIADHLTDGLGRIYPIGVQEARVNHPEQSGFFSGACGITYYGGGAFPDGFNGNILVTDVVLNLVHRDRLTADGPGFVASRGRPKAEFLASKDRAFRPVNLSVGPDGALYVIDFHRTVIEHPEWIPDELEKAMDLKGGRDKGRIYRVVPKAGLPPRIPRFEPNDLESVVLHLADSNKWWRDTAQRLLVEWNESASVPLLEDLVRTSPNALARVHALWTLRGMGRTTDVGTHLGRLRSDMLLQGLADPEPGVRENAVLLAESEVAVSGEIRTVLMGMANDPNPRVRLQVALSLGGLNRGADEGGALEVEAALLRVLEQDLQNPWTRLAVLSGMGERPYSAWARFLDRAVDRGPAMPAEVPEGALEFVRALSEIVGGEAGSVVESLRWVQRHAVVEAPIRLAILEGLRSGARKRTGRYPLREKDRGEMSGILAGLEEGQPPDILRSLWSLSKAVGLAPSDAQGARLRAAAMVAGDAKRSLEDRLANLRLLDLSWSGEFVEALFGLLNHRHPKVLQEEAMRQLTLGRQPGIAGRMVDVWSELGPGSRLMAGDFLLYRSENHDLLLTALEKGKIPMGQLNLDLERRRRLLRSQNQQTVRRASVLFSDAGVVTRAAALQAMKPALRVQGDVDKGVAVFNKTCATCHRISGNGNSVGPDLTDIYRKSAETLLQDILDPNAAVNTEFLSFSAETVDGEVKTGLLIGETEELITLREAGGNTITVPRRSIESLRSSGLSLMPEELESVLSHEEMADLIAYLQQPR
jgi:putative membrane-bound dehydrogenase-like protein